MATLSDVKTSTRRSRRTEVLEARPINRDGFVEEWPEVGLIAMESPHDPKPSMRVENGIVVEMDGKERAEFDFIDQFIADHARLLHDPCGLIHLTAPSAVAAKVRTFAG